MLLQQWQEAVQRAVLLAGQPAGAATIAVLASLLLWRFVRFTLYPAFHPAEPKEYPYWLPGIGHLGSFLSNTQTLLTHSRIYFGDTREPYALAIAKFTFYIITKSADVQATYRNTATLSFDIFGQEILRYLGVSQDAVKTMYGRSNAADALHPNPSGKSLARMSRDFHIYQLYPSNKLSDISERFHCFLDGKLTIEKLALVGKSCSRAGENEVLMSLYRWSDEMLAESIADCYFGESLRKIEPDFVRIYLEFSEHSWRALFLMPEVLGKKMFRPLRSLVDILEKWFELPMEERRDTVWYTTAIEAEMRHVGISNRDMAIMLLTIYWGANTNTSRGVFWTLSHVLFDPELKANIRAETEPAFKHEKLDVQHIYDRSPILRATWNEVLRTASYSSSVRLVVEDTVIGGKTLKKGNRIMMPYRQMHFDESIFGADVHQFNINRFLKNPGLSRNVMAFGGGATQCPGRHFSAQAAMVLVAELLYRFEIRLNDESQSFPQVDETRPVLGMIDIKKETDLRVRLSPRQF
ncbi:hypothetical protein QQS21_003277 [Conoideocrella luteorostrata]|uniref:Cytochrome P450 n=1 Tax=Conoideocrella luteorostrata TaxID=1105319 RepID=A0AAJ0CTR4_9HYPO|nr:hypothetical protein QQS21_003277 [Conoideocrella luteorostrata]